MHAPAEVLRQVMASCCSGRRDKMTFGSDYGIWEPRWQIEGFVDWDYPSDEFSDFPRVTTATKRRSSG